MTVKLWKTFSKRLNSTKQPSDPATAELTCRLKDNTSLHDPVLEIATNDFGYEYAYISDFGKYYFVRDVVSKAYGLCEYHLTEDVLATYKTAIGSSSFHVIYASASTDIEIIDPRVVVKTSKAFHTSGGGETERVFPSSGGCYILSVFNDQDYYVDGSRVTDVANGMAVTIALEPADMENLRIGLADSDVLTHINQFIDGEPLKAIFHCIWVPYSLNTLSIGIPVSLIRIGNQVISASLPQARIVNGNPVITNTISVNCHLRSGYINSFRASEPYTTGTIYLPGVGVVNLNMSDWRGSTKINVQYTIECITGNMRYFLKRDDGMIVGTFDCCVASPCPLGQEVLNGAGVVGGVMGAVGGLASMGVSIASGGAGAAFAGSALALSMGAANTALAANKRDVMTTGNIGGRMVQTQPFIYHTEFTVDTEPPAASGYIAERGLPYAGVAQISTMTSTAGKFIQCEGASINCTASGLEKEEINNHLNNGFYYE